MGNMVQKFREQDAAWIAKRDENCRLSIGWLSRVGVPFEAHNAGTHLIVLAAGKKIDFWPGTGLWMARGSDEQGRGVRGLIEHVKRQKAASPKESQ